MYMAVIFFSRPNIKRGSGVCVCGGGGVWKMEGYRGRKKSDTTILDSGPGHIVADWLDQYQYNVTA